MRHRNSLGYAIGHSGDAYIVWGYEPNGRLIGIDEAVSGGRQGLICECGIHLIAKKGDILAHHFAHASGYAVHCEVATKAAALRFISTVLSNSGFLVLPDLAGFAGARTAIVAVRERGFDDFPIHEIEAPKGKSLKVVSRIKAKSVQKTVMQAKAANTSTIAIDLFRVRNQADAKLAAAIISTAPRKWLHRSHSRDHLSNKEIMRRLFGLGQKF